MVRSGSMTATRSTPGRASAFDRNLGDDFITGTPTCNLEAKGLIQTVRRYMEHAIIISSQIGKSGRQAPL